MLGSALEHLDDLLSPPLELLALRGAIMADINRIVDDAAEGIHGVERVALGLREAEEGIEEIRAALAREPGDELCRGHGLM
jgi:hypothetical protein